MWLGGLVAHALGWGFRGRVQKKIRRDDVPILELPFWGGGGGTELSERAGGSFGRLTLCRTEARYCIATAQRHGTSKGRGGVQTAQIGMGKGHCQKCTVRAGTDCRSALPLLGGSGREGGCS